MKRSRSMDVGAGMEHAMGATKARRSVTGASDGGPDWRPSPSYQAAKVAPGGFSLLGCEPGRAFPSHSIDFEALVEEEGAWRKPSIVTAKYTECLLPEMADPGVEEWLEEPVIAADRLPSLTSNPHAGFSPAHTPRTPVTVVEVMPTDLDSLIMRRAEGAAAEAPGSERRLNRNFAVLNAGAEGVDASAAATRLHKALSVGEDAALNTCMRGENGRGGPPARLLAPLASALHTLARVRGQGDSPLVPGPVAYFDGLHLTLCGMAAALVAWNNGSSIVRAPAGYAVVTAPREGGVYGPPPAGTSAEEDPVDDTVACLDFLTMRWAALGRLLDGASGEALQQCRAFLKALASGDCPPPPAALSALHAAHISALCVPANVVTFVNTSPEGAPLAGPAVAGSLGNAALAKLLGSNEACALAGSQHPGVLMHRCRALVEAAAAGWDSWQWESQHLRVVPRVTPPTAAAAVSSTVSSSPLVSPFYAVSTCHFERYATSGAVFARTTYLSDVLLTRAVVPRHSLHATPAQVAAVSQLVVQGPGAGAGSPSLGASLLAPLLSSFPDSALLAVACRAVLLSSAHGEGGGGGSAPPSALAAMVAAGARHNMGSGERGQLVGQALAAFAGHPGAKVALGAQGRPLTQPCSLLAVLGGGAGCDLGTAGQLPVPGFPSL